MMVEDGLQTGRMFEGVLLPVTGFAREKENQNIWIWHVPAQHFGNVEWLLN